MSQPVLSSLSGRGTSIVSSLLCYDFRLRLCAVMLLLHFVEQHGRQVLVLHCVGLAVGIIGDLFRLIAGIYLDA